jgi:hypothetical protein
MPDTIRQITSCYAENMEAAKIKLHLPPNATLDDVLRRVIHGNAKQDLSLEGWLMLGKKFITPEHKESQ